MIFIYSQKNEKYACSNGARCLPMWGNVLAQVGHAACP